MKRTLLSVIMSLTLIALNAASGFQVNYTQTSTGNHQLEFTLDEYNIINVNYQGNDYSKILFEGKIVTERKGFAELPYLNASVMLDPQKNVTLEIVPGDYEEISLSHPLVPSRGVIYRNQDPATVPYVVDPRSLTDSWYPLALAGDTEPFILRDIRGTSVYVYPFQYNAARQVLRIYKSITVNLVENNTLSLNPLPKAPEKIVREMDGIYRSVFINYDPSNRDDLTIGEFGDIHVIVTSRDEEAIQPYVQWKREKGYDVSVEVVATGTVVNSNVQAAYDNNNDILYVLLVGDWADLQCTTNSYGRPMDPQVGTVVGSDDYADISVGRFSANSPADVTVQVNKVITYERDPDMTGTWYSYATGIGSNEGIGSGDDGEGDYEHEQVIWDDKLDPFTYTDYSPIYDPGASSSMVFTAVNAGTSVINYTGHGWSGGWSTSGFNSTNVASLENGDKLPFIVSVACNNGDFDLGTCYGEAWLRKEAGGAIMFLGGSISQPWNPPMRGQDYFMDVLIGGYDYTAHPGQNGINTTEQRTTLGSIVFNGLTLMCVESGSGSDWETAMTWNMFGDPSVQARTRTPLDISLSNTLIMVGIPFTTTVTSSEGATANAMVTLSQDGQYFTGITDDNGNVTIDHTLNPGAAKLVVTGFNTGTIFEDVSVIPPDGPYVTVASVVVSDELEGNGNGQLDYGEPVSLTIGLTNVGSEDAANVIAVLSSIDENVYISGNNNSYGLIPAGDTVYVNDGFQLVVSETIPDMHEVLFDLAATSDTRDTWVSSFTLTGHAPVLQMGAYAIDDSAGNNNGRLDPGETVLVSIEAQNTGSAEAYSLAGMLSCTNEFVSISNSPQDYGDLPAGETIQQTFEIVINEMAPAGEAPQFVFDMMAYMNISGQGSFTEYIGQIPVLLIDWDNNHNSPSVIEQCLINLQVGYDKMDAFPEDRNLYTSIFVCLGTYDQNHVLTADEGQILADYLAQGGNLYMEGADTWYYDQLSDPTPVHPMFNIAGVDDGSDDLVLLAGQPGTMVEDMSFTFTGDNSYIDHIEAIDPAQMMFMNTSPVYGTAVCYDAGTYRTVGFAFEFGGLQDGDKNKDDLMIKILEFFGIQGVWTDVKENQPVNSLIAGAYPNPFRDEILITFETREKARVSVSIYNVSGQLINLLYDKETPAGVYEVLWNGKDSFGNSVAEGIYFYRLQAGNDVTGGKLMRME